GVAFRPDGRQVVVCGGTYEDGKPVGKRKGFVQAYGLELDRALLTFDFADPVHRVQFHPESKLVSVLIRNNYSGNGPHFLIRQYDADWQLRGVGRVDTNFLSVSHAGRSAVSREWVDEPGMGRVERGVLWDLAQLEAMGAKKGQSFEISK